MARHNIADILKAKYGQDYFSRIGKLGGGGGAFVKDHNFAVECGRKGGLRTQHKRVDRANNDVL